MKDLVILAPDNDVKSGIESLLKRSLSLNIRKISCDFVVHPFRDPGVYQNPHDLLRSSISSYAYAIIFVDYEGCGQEEYSPQIVEQKIKEKIELNGWQGRGEVIVFIPEVEIWLWTDSPHAAIAMGWRSFLQLKNWLISGGMWQANSNKPHRPKDALKLALKEKGIPMSSSIFKEVAEKVSFVGCQEQAFLRFKNILQTWFPTITS